MDSVKEFETEILSKLLLANGLEELCKLVEKSTPVIDFSGVGYFLTIKDKGIPMERYVLDRPHIIGELGGVQVGYLAFIDSFELTLECYSYGEEINVSHREKGFVYTAI